MGSHKAAKRCDRGFADPFLVTKAHIEMPFSYLLDSLRGSILGNPSHKERGLGEVNPTPSPSLHVSDTLGGPADFGVSLSSFGHLHNCGIRAYTGVGCDRFPRDLLLRGP